jgi:hypothetical protein
MLFQELQQYLLLTYAVPPAGQKNVPYNQVLFNATGGDGHTYNWELIDGTTLPAGMSRVGNRLQGTPTCDSGSYPFKMKVTSLPAVADGGTFDTLTYTIYIKPAVPTYNPLWVGANQTDTWYVPEGVSWIHIDFFGAAGGGGGACLSWAQGTTGGGGGGGAYRFAEIAVTYNQAIGISVGAGGGGATHDTETDGSNGGNTTVTVSGVSHIANGGYGGKTSRLYQGHGAGGAGATGGSINGYDGWNGSNGGWGGFSGGVYRPCYNTT